jgi:DNA-binding transcriptional LysR family regulator
MELRHLRYFLAVAQELNFTRAAERLCMTQPPLTQQIKALEAELGFDLFDRSSYRVELTAAGRVFAAEASRILRDVRTAVQFAQHAARGTAGSIRVGFTESSSFNPVVAASLRRFRLEYPDVQIDLDENPSLELLTAIREGRMDAAFVRPPLPQSVDIAFLGLEDEPLVVALPSSHPLANRDLLDLRDLAFETFILYPRAVRPGLADAIIAACEHAGFTPRVGQNAPQLSSTINLIAASLGISIVPRSMDGMQRHLVSYVPLSGVRLAASLGIAHRMSERARTVRNFVRIAQQAQVQCL